VCVLGVLGVLELIVERECKIFVGVVCGVVDENEGGRGEEGWSLGAWCKFPPKYLRYFA